MFESEFNYVERIAKLEEQLKTQLLLIDDQKSTIATILADNDRLLKENNKLESENKKLKEELDDVNGTIASLTKLIESSQPVHTSGFIWTAGDDGDFDSSTTEDSVTTTVTYTGSFPDPSADRFPEENDDTEGCYLEGCIGTNPSEVNNYHAPQFNFTGPVIISGDKDIISDALDRYYTHINGGYEPTDECSL